MGKITNGLRRFMQGRYGSDKLNTVILVTGLVACVASAFVSLLTKENGADWWRFLLIAISYGLMFWALFRCFSRNTYKRYRENRKFLLMLEKIKDRDHKYFTCPKCRQSVRVPKGKGKIAISCPKCREKFIKKT